MNRIISFLLAGLAVIASLFAALFSNERTKTARREAEQAKASQNASEEATEALIRGLNEESKPITRGHFNRK